ncbi:MAG: PAS domain S-box protein [Victivallales bacterium]|nr:PAS domain S-box protein [Victivallales bacterium]
MRNRAQEQLRASEEEFRVLVENMQIGLVVHAPDGTVSFANPLASQLLGQTPGEMYGKSAADPTWFFIREDGERALPVEYPVNRALANDSVTAQVLGIVRGDGSDTTWVQCNTHSAQDSEGRCKQMIVTFLDITQRRKAKEALQESEQRFRTFFDGSLHFALILDEKGTVLEMNGRCSEATGQYARGVVGNPLWEAGWWKEFPDVQEKTKAAIRRSSEGEDTDDEVTFIDADHRIHHGLRTFSPIGNGADGVKTIAVVGLDITDRKQAEEVILRQQYSLEKAQELGQIGSWELDLRQNSLSWSDENCRIFGVPPGSVVDYETFLERVHPDDRDDVHREWSAALGGRPYDIEHRLAGHGVMRWVREKASVEFDEEGKAVRALGFTQDITEHKLLEERLRQSERMDAIGQLAGGVAHDFNNMLAVILGHTEIVLDGMDPAQPIYADLQEVLRATERSADLTRQLLTFARKQVVVPEVLDVNKTLAGMLKMLRRLIGENINLDWQPKEGLWSVMMDPSQIDQILANLCVNARDAIGDVGAITITLGNVALDEACSPGHVGPVPGEYVLLSVSDNGCGMDQETVAQVFEPFFTTKEVGKGTGLGLATVYGIVQQNSGGIDICSEPGRGTTFEIYLPRCQDAEQGLAVSGTARDGRGGNETILVAEDEAAILEVCDATLGRLGYRVLVASTPDRAIELASDHAQAIDLLLTDVVMPTMHGRALAEQVRRHCPGIPCVYMSGYPDKAIADYGIVLDGLTFLAKPFSRQQLAEKVREALGRRGEVGQG